MSPGLPQSAGRFVQLLAAYFILQVVLRLLLGDYLEIDEAEQLILGQRLQSGYSAQPPLYTWIQIGLFSLFGEGVLATALLKNLLLFNLYLCSYFIARRLALTPLQSAAAALSLLLLPQIGWESQRDLTHSVLVTSVAAATLLLALVMLARGARPRHYLLLGVLIGCGVLSKLNFVFFLAALVLALFSIQRRLVWNPLFALSLLIAALLITPYGLWIADSLEFATAGVKKLNVDAAPESGIPSLVLGLASLFKAIAQFSALFLLIYLLALRSWPRGWSPLARGDGPDDARLLLLRMLGFSLAILLLYLAFSGASTFRDRWLLPLLFYLPPLFFALTPRASLNPGAVARYGYVLLLSMLLIPFGLFARVYLEPLFDSYSKPHFPAQTLAQALQTKLGERNVVFAQDVLIAGNLKLHLPRHFVAYSSVDFTLPEHDGIMLAWNGRKFITPPDRITDHLQAYLPPGRLDPECLGSIEMPLRLSGDKLYHLRYQRYLLDSQTPPAEAADPCLQR
ncbi:MAG: glycosyltransferase family 39 protein [Gammaproteobacteria bacterium]|nr:glycosyltransferase family 39 protein [Gammaproteobacteria bacterium]